MFPRVDAVVATQGTAVDAKPAATVDTLDVEMIPGSAASAAAIT